MIKHCRKCKRESEFGKDRRRNDGLQPYCKECTNTISRKYYRRRTNEGWKDDGTASRKKLMELIFDTYGAKCACCGESTKEFLTLDHKGQWGSEHKKRHNGNTYQMLADVVRENFPDTYQILCWNCNCVQRFGHRCPHETGNLEMLAMAMCC